jgi:hypothetical protein
MMEPTFREDWERNKISAVLIHGCSAILGLGLVFAGAGVVYCLGMWIRSLGCG